MLRQTVFRAISQARRAVPPAAPRHTLTLRQLTAAAAGSPDPPRTTPPAETAVPAGGAEEEEEDVNLLEAKQTRDLLHSALSARATDAIRYEYFAQRADLEAEVDVAPLFRTLSETAKQQTMGYLELMEEYGDAEFGSTVRNLEVAAEAERTAADNALKEAATVASDEGFEQIEEWYQDMMDAGYRAADRLEAVSALLDDEGVGEEITEESLMDDSRRN